MREEREKREEEKRKKRGEERRASWREGREDKGRIGISIVGVHLWCSFDAAG